MTVNTIIPRQSAVPGTAFFMRILYTERSVIFSRRLVPVRSTRINRAYCIVRKKHLRMRSPNQLWLIQFLSKFPKRFRRNGDFYFFVGVDSTMFGVINLSWKTCHQHYIFSGSSWWYLFRRSARGTCRIKIYCNWISEPVLDTENYPWRDRLFRGQEILAV